MMHARHDIDALLVDEPLADRADHVARLADGAFDLVVIGGGITGAGVALDAVSRGLSVALVEAGDFSSGTSSRSSKMIHGGFRYLQTGDIALVRESLRERTTLQRTAPHLVRTMPFMIPLFLKCGVINPKLSRALGGALWSYQFAGAWRLGRRHRRLSHEEVAAHMPALDMTRIGAGYLFHDLRADDARLTYAVLASAAERGAVVVNHARCTGLSAQQSGMRRVSIALDDGQITAQARMVVNATGIWAQRLLGAVGIDTTRRLAPAKGTHLVVPIEKLRTDLAVSLPVASDRRTVSVVNEGPFAYVGSTETTDPADIENPSVTEADISYILDGINRHLRTPVDPSDITSGWAGFRPLIADSKSKRSSDLSRKHSIEIDAPGLITVTGGKLTTYREMAEGVVDAVCQELDLKRRCQTRRLPLFGYSSGSSHLDWGTRLGKRYGNRAAKVEQLAALDPDLAARITPNGDTILAELVWGLRAEMGISLPDVLLRRTRLGTYDGRAVLADADRIAARVGHWMGWGANRMSAEAEILKNTLRRELGVLAHGLAAQPDSRGKEETT